MKFELTKRDTGLISRRLCYRRLYDPQQVKKLGPKNKQKYTESLKDLIIFLYLEKHWPIEKIGSALNLGRYTIQQGLKRWGVKRIIGQDLKAKIIKDNKDWIIERYTDKINPWLVSKIAKELGVGESSISRNLTSWGIPNRKPILRSETQRILSLKNQMIEDYEKDGLTVPQISKKYDIPESTLNLRFGRWGVKIRDRQKLAPDRAVRLYEGGWSPREIAENAELQTSDVYRILKNQGIRSKKKYQLDRTHIRILRYFRNRGMPVPQIVRVFRKRFPKKKDITEQIVRSRYQKWGLKEGFPPEPDDAELMTILNLSAQMKPLDEIADAIEAPVSVVRDTIDKYKIKRYLPNSKGTYGEDFVDLIAPDIKKLRLGTPMTIKQIAKKLGVSTSVVEKSIAKHKIPYRKRVLTNAVMGDIRARHMNGDHYRDIAKALRLMPETVRQAIFKMGLVPVRKWKNMKYSRRAVKLQTDYINKFYRAPYYSSTKELSRKLGIDSTTIRKRMATARIPVRTSSEGQKIRFHKRKVPWFVNPGDRDILTEKVTAEKLLV